MAAEPGALRAQQHSLSGAQPVANAPGVRVTRPNRLGQTDRPIPGRKNALSERVFSFVTNRFGLRQNELDAGLDGEVFAAQNRDGGKRPMLSFGAPALLEARVFLALERLAAHGGGEHASFTPAPDFLAGEVQDHEVVGLAV